MSMTLGRPPGISDDDIDVSLPKPDVDPITAPLTEMCAQSMVSAVHYFKLKRIESQIQRLHYTVVGRDRAQTAESSWTLLRQFDQWEADIPLDASSRHRDNLPCCSRDWFQLRGIEARLHLLRPMCSESRGEALSLLAQNAAKGCELQYIISDGHTNEARATLKIQEEDTSVRSALFKYLGTFDIHMWSCPSLWAVPRPESSASS